MKQKIERQTNLSSANTVSNQISANTPLCAFIRRDVRHCPRHFNTGAMIILSTVVLLIKHREGQWSLACCSPWGCKELDMTEWLDNTNTMWNYVSSHFDPIILLLSNWPQNKGHMIYMAVQKLQSPYFQDYLIMNTILQLYLIHFLTPSTQSLMEIQWSDLAWGENSVNTSSWFIYLFLFHILKSIMEASI